MLLRNSQWKRIREQFTEQEKAELRTAVQGQMICPRGWAIDQENLQPNLYAKLFSALATAKERK